MYDVNWWVQDRYMVQEIATACGLAMTAVDGGWSHFAGNAAVVPDRTAERS